MLLLSKERETETERGSYNDIHNIMFHKRTLTIVAINSSHHLTINVTVITLHYKAQCLIFGGTMVPHLIKNNNDNTRVVS